jgi:hypothetical protein
VPEIAKSQVADALRWFTGGGFRGNFQRWFDEGLMVLACIELSIVVGLPDFMPAIGSIRL